MNIVIPMAGEGSRFREAGYTFPKPLIEVHGHPMISKVVRNLQINGVRGHFIFLVRRELLDMYELPSMFDELCRGSKDTWQIVEVDRPTEGAACTILLAKQWIDNNEPLCIANSDQLIEVNHFGGPEQWYLLLDGGLYVFRSTHPKWSYVTTSGGRVVQVAEKRVISDIATTGIYFWRKGSDFVKYAEEMIKCNDRFNNEFYVAPVYNYAIVDGKEFAIQHVSKMWGLGDPESLQEYLRKNDR